MSYTPPTIDASGQDYTALRSRGFSGFIRSLVNALTTNAATIPQKTLVGQLLTQNQASFPMLRAASIVNNALGGKTTKAEAKDQLFDLQLAYASIAASIGEIAVLIDAH